MECIFLRLEVSLTRHKGVSTRWGRGKGDSIITDSFVRRLLQSTFYVTNGPLIVRKRLATGRGCATVMQVNQSQPVFCLLQSGDCLE